MTSQTKMDAKRAAAFEQMKRLDEEQLLQASRPLAPPRTLTSRSIPAQAPK